ncbi:MAG: hypothetical protein IJL91_06965 [Bacteroidales bacterium]|nr:hypothetical protein [Bacteroidales bacterium]
MTHMSDLELQKELYNRVTAFLEEKGLQFPSMGEEAGEDAEGNPLAEPSWKAFNVYIQDKPFKTDENDEAEENYIIIILNDEDGISATEEWDIEIQFIIGIELYENEHQGNLIIANVMNNLWKLFRTTTINGATLDRHNKAKRFNQENYPNFYEGALITHWRVPDVAVTEGTEELL